MRGLAVAVMSMVLSTAVWAQSPAKPPSRSVWVDEHTPAEITAAVAAGKTTVVYSGGSSLAAPRKRL